MSSLLTTRRKNMLTGAIAIVVLVGAASIGIKGAFGAFAGGYELVGHFDAAGQGLLSGSDVKVRGVNVGEVRSIELVDGAARITLRIEDGERIPDTASAVIRPKTLFGEKFVDLDLGPGEGSGPYLDDGDRITETRGGFELEAVLTDLHPLLQAIDPAELMTVVGELADAGDGLGEAINRTIDNGAELSSTFAENAENTRQFLEDFADLSEQLAGDADDLLELADAGNIALPTLNQGESAVVDLLQQAGRLSNDVADLLQSNRPFVDAALGDGSRTLQVLFDERDQVIPLVIGIRQYVQTLSEIIRIRVGDGTLMAAVKAVLGGELCGIIPCPRTGEAPAASVERPAEPPAPSVSGPDAPVAPPLDVGRQRGDDLFDLLGRLLGA